MCLSTSRSSGRGLPLLLMHAAPGLDHVSLTPFRQLADRHTVVFYDHRCNGRSTGVPVTSMTWENLTADADALREALGFERWAVLGHSFGGHVALEYALRYPDRVSQLVLLDTAGDARWSQENAAEVLAGRGFSPKTVAVARRFYDGRIAPKDFVRAAIRLLPAYDHRFSLLRLAREMLEDGWRVKARPEALTFGGQVMRGWSVMDRLGEIHRADLGHRRARRLPLPRPRARPSSPPVSRTLGCTSSSGPVTTRSPSDRPRRWRPSRISLPWRHCSRPDEPRTRPSCRRRRHEPDDGGCRHPPARDSAHPAGVYVHERRREAEPRSPSAPSTASWPERSDVARPHGSDGQ